MQAGPRLPLGLHPPVGELAARLVGVGVFDLLSMGYLVDSSSHYILGVGVPALGASTIVL